MLKSSMQRPVHRLLDHLAAPEPPGALLLNASHMAAWSPAYSCRPAFMVVGAPKCGSTSLFKWLEAHPDVQTPAHKELCYFSAFKRRLTRYRPSAATVWELYMSAFAGHRAYAAAMAARGLGSSRARWRSRHGVRGGGGGGTSRLLQQTGAAAAAAAAAGGCDARGKLAFEGCPFYLGEHLAPQLLRATFPRLRALAVLRNPRERTVSAFNDYVRVGRISRASGTGARMEELAENIVSLVRSGARSLEDYDVRILTSGVYVHGIRRWGEVWPASQLLLVQAERLFDTPVAEMKRVFDFVGLHAERMDTRKLVVHNRGRRVARPSRRINQTLDNFFAPYNEQLYEWCWQRGLPFARWPNATI